MPELTEAQRRELEALRQAYEAELAQKVTTIAQTAASLGTGEWDRTGLQSLHQLIHRLAGSSAIWGFTAVSEAAGRLEDLMMSALEGTAPPTLAAEVQRLVEALRQAVPRAADPAVAGPTVAAS